MCWVVLFEKPPVPFTGMSHLRGLIMASSAPRISLGIAQPIHPSLVSVFARWRYHRIVPQKFVWFVVVHSNGVANGKMFGMRCVTALSVVGAGVDLVEQSHLREKLSSQSLSQLF